MRRFAIFLHALVRVHGMGYIARHALVPSSFPSHLDASVSTSPWQIPLHIHFNIFVMVRLFFPLFLYRIHSTASGGAWGNYMTARSMADIMFFYCLFYWPFLELKGIRLSLFPGGSFFLIEAKQPFHHPIPPYYVLS